MNECYKVDMDYYAIDLEKSKSAGKKVRKLFSKNSYVYGTPYLGSKKGIKSDNVIIRKRFLIPTDYLTKSPEVAGRISPVNSDNENLDIIQLKAKQIHSDNMSNADGTIKNVFSSKFEKNAMAVNNGWKLGAGAGSVLGLVVALVLRKPYWIGALIGGVGGGYLGQEIVKNNTRSKLTEENSVDL